MSPSPLPLKVGGHVPQLLWERRPCRNETRYRQSGKGVANWRSLLHHIKRLKIRAVFTHTPYTFGIRRLPDLIANILGMTGDYRQWGKGVWNYKGSPTPSQNHKLRSINSFKKDQFLPTLCKLRSPFYFIAKLRAQRSANGTQTSTNRRR